MKEKSLFCLDSSAIFSGKPIDFSKGKYVTTSKIADEFSPGGRDYHRFQLLCDQGLIIMDPSDKSIQVVNDIIKKYGENKRLSTADMSILALAYHLKKENQESPILITDDYSMQNIADHLDLKYFSMNQKGITKRFKWERRCQGCRKLIINDVDVCPICGSPISHRVKRSTPVNKERKM